MISLKKEFVSVKIGYNSIKNHMMAILLKKLTINFMIAKLITTVIFASGLVNSCIAMSPISIPILWTLVQFLR